jgi:hypothetical protein
MTEHRFSPKFSKQFEGRHVSKPAARVCLIRLSVLRRLEGGGRSTGYEYMQNWPLAGIESAQNAMNKVANTA